MSLSSGDFSSAPSAQILQLKGTFEGLVTRKNELAEEIQVIDETLLRNKEDRYRQFRSNREAVEWRRAMVADKMKKEQEIRQLRRRIADAQHQNVREIQARLEDEGIDPTDPVSVAYHLLELVLENDEIGSVDYTRSQRRTISIACALLEHRGVRSRS